jgi:putative nucleotidyltransferase with HDIG domain
MTAHEMVAKARKLPQIPGSALRLVELLDEPENNTQEVVEMIRGDALLTAKLLRICNSAALGLAEPVSSVDQAVLMLGFAQVLSLVISLAFGNAMTGTLPAYAVEADELWRHAFGAATAAEMLAARNLCPGVDGSVGFTAGLLHDIGKLVMAQSLTSELHWAIRQRLSGQALTTVEAERQVVGTDHAEVGACLLHIWRLPDRIVEAVVNHHKPVVEPTPQLSAITFLANRIAHLAVGGPGSEAYAFQDREPVVGVFELSAEQLEELVNAVGKSAERAKDIQAIV